MNVAGKEHNYFAVICQVKEVAFQLVRLEARAEVSALSPSKHRGPLAVSHPYGRTCHSQTVSYLCA